MLLIKFRYLLLLLFSFLICSTYANDSLKKEKLLSKLVNQSKSFICVPVEFQIGLNEFEIKNELDKQAKPINPIIPTENLSSLTALRLTSNENNLNNSESNLNLKKSEDLLIDKLNKDDLKNEKELNSISHKDETIKTNETFIIANKDMKALVTISDETVTMPTLREEESTELNDINLNNNKSTTDDKLSIKNQLNSNSNVTDIVNNNQARSVISGRQTGLLGNLLSSFKPASAIDNLNGKNHLDTSSQLVGDEKEESKLFIQQQALEKNNEKLLEETNSSINQNSGKSSEPNELNGNSTNDAKSTVTSSTTTTTTTTTAAPTSSSTTLSPEDLENQKIFAEFFGARNAASPSMKNVFSGLLSKIGFASKAPLPPAVLKEKLEAEIKDVQLPTVEPLPMNQIKYSTPLPILSTSDYSNPNGYISYDTYSKQINDVQNKYLIDPKDYNTKYQPKPQYPINKEQDYVAEKPQYPVNKTQDYAVEKHKYLETPPIKVSYPKVDPKADYTTIDKLKGHVNGPVEIPALKEQLPKTIKIKDYVEDDSEKSSYRTNNFRLTDLTPFNRVATFHRYGKIVSSVGKGVSSLYPGYKPGKSIYPLYGMYGRN